VGEATARQKWFAIRRRCGDRGAGCGHIIWCSKRIEMAKVT
jgi:hypothetical protein